MKLHISKSDVILILSLKLYIYTWWIIADYIKRNWKVKVTRNTVRLAGRYNLDHMLFYWTYKNDLLFSHHRTFNQTVYNTSYMSTSSFSVCSSSVMIVTLVFSVLVTTVVHGFPDGAPVDACVKPRPNQPYHGQARTQPTHTNPYLVVASADNYGPGTQVTGNGPLWRIIKTY